MADPAETTQVSKAPPELEEQELLAAVRALATQVGELRTELHALRSEAPALPEHDGVEPGWQEAPGSLRDGGAWVRSLDAPTYRRLSIPWLLLEVMFLLAVAILTAVAGLSAPAIVGLMAGSWLVVAAAEWASARAEGRRRELVYGGYAPVPLALPEDPSWLEPPAERTKLDVSSKHETAITRLPPPAAE